MLERIRADNGVVFHRSPLLRQIGVLHGFSTRIGGISPPPFDTLNLGNPSGPGRKDDQAHITANAARFGDAIECSDHRPCWVHQVHGCGVVGMPAEAAEFKNGQPADAMVSRAAGRLLTVRTADCVPLLLAAPDGAVVAAVHAGWRGIVAGVIPAAVAALTAEAGNPAGELLAAIGPCIGLDAFEVGPEVLAAFRGVFGPRAPLRTLPNGKGQLDLREAAMLQALGVGLSRHRIDVCDRCTFRDADEFFSHRRDRGLTGRMVAAIAPTPAALRPCPCHCVAGWHRSSSS
jgi:hypothetical protein